MASEPVRDLTDAPKHATRATRSTGQRTRSRLLDAASSLFKARGLNAVSIADIAAAADAFPSQITYYFRTKEALFVEAACRDVLHAAHAAEEAAHGAATPEGYTRALVDAVMRTDALGFFVEAMTLTRRRADLMPLIARTVERLHQEGQRAYAGEMQARGWRSRRDPATSAQKFWTIAVGVTLEGQAMGRTVDDLAADMLRLLETQADAVAAGRAPLRLVDRDDATDNPAEQSEQNGEDHR
ncbi:MAG: TetR/AcrR family transcriptional regulator C-terminal domain-containing protein [Pseudomonadota bacterium]|jgi:AcrR family transcriptional regulator